MMERKRWDEVETRYFKRVLFGWFNYYAAPELTDDEIDVLVERAIVAMKVIAANERPKLSLWQGAPAWAKWHTWDHTGKTWWSQRPQLDGHTWMYPLGGNELVPEYLWYDDTPCPIEIDPALTLRRRPKQEPTP
jgi:hypothetical protein